MKFGGWEITLNDRETMKISFLIKPDNKDIHIPKEEIEQKLSSLTDNITKDVINLLKEKYDIHIINSKVSPIVED